MTTLLILIAALVLVIALLAIGLCMSAAEGDRQADAALAMLRDEVQAIYRTVDHVAGDDTDLAVQLAAREFRPLGLDGLDMHLMLAVRYEKSVDEVRWLTAGNLDGIKGPKA